MTDKEIKEIIKDMILKMWKHGGYDVKLMKDRLSAFYDERKWRRDHDFPFYIDYPGNAGTRELLDLFTLLLCLEEEEEKVEMIYYHDEKIH